MAKIFVNVCLCGNVRTASGSHIMKYKLCQKCRAEIKATRTVTCLNCGDVRLENRAKPYGVTTVSFCKNCQRGGSVKKYTEEEAKERKKASNRRNYKPKPRKPKKTITKETEENIDKNLSETRLSVKRSINPIRKITNHNNGLAYKVTDKPKEVLPQSTPEQDAKMIEEFLAKNKPSVTFN